MHHPWAVYASFVLSTMFYIIQHYRVGISWDFAVYVMNGKFFFGAPEYFELGRAPLTSLLLGIFSFLGIYGEYVYIIGVSLLFLYASIRLADALNLDASLFYTLSITPFTLMYGTFAGTELLSLALIELGVASIIEGRVAGHWLALASLVRYPNIPVILLLLGYLNFRKSIQNSAVFAAVWIPWLLYNRLFFDNLFASLANTYLLNIASRANAQYYFSLMEFLLTMNITLLLLVVGILLPLYEGMHTLLRKGNLTMAKRDVMSFALVALLLILPLTSMITMPVKIPRYLFILIAPSVVFFLKGVQKKRFANKKNMALLLAALLIINCIFAFSHLIRSNADDPERYKTAARIAVSSPVKNCSFMSDEWVPLNAVGFSARPIPPYRKNYEYFLDKGYAYLIFYSYEEFYAKLPPNSIALRDEYLISNEILKTAPVIYSDASFMLIGDPKKCRGREMQYVNIYLDWYQENMRLNESLNACDVLFSGDIMQSMCRRINVQRNH